MNHQYDPYEIKLANEIADTLNDRDSITMHLQYVRRYKEDFLRKKLAKAMAVPEKDVRTNRGAIYTFLIRQSEKYGGSGA